MSFIVFLFVCFSSSWVLGVDVKSPALRFYYGITMKSSDDMHLTDRWSQLLPFYWTHTEMSRVWAGPLPVTLALLGCANRPTALITGLPGQRVPDITVLSELRGAEKRRDPKRLLGGLRGLRIAPKDDALGEGQFEVAGSVLKSSVFFTLL